MIHQSIHSNIADEINAIDSRLAQLDVERKQLIQQKNVLLNQPISEPLASSFTPEQKVSLFQSLFRGRMDIFAARWQNSKGRSGYSACLQ